MRRTIWLPLAAILLTACGQSTPIDAAEIEIDVFLVRPEGGPGTVRSGLQIGSLAQDVNEIWAPAGIRFLVDQVTPVLVPPDALAAMAGGSPVPFLDAVESLTAASDRAPIQVFAVPEVATGGGLAAFGLRLVVIGDRTRVAPGRVLAHELGHVLGLGHVNDEERLMAGGSNGTGLTESESRQAQRRVEELGGG